MKSYFIFLSFILSTFLLTGCASNRSILDIQGPVLSESTIPKSTDKEVFINLPIDKRKFEKKPPFPDTPSLNYKKPHGDEIKVRAVARKRNGYGMAMGDILLPEGRTVALLIQDCLRQALIEQGYSVIDDKSKIMPSTYMVDTDILKFWSWVDLDLGYIITEVSTVIRMQSTKGVNEQKIYFNAYGSFFAATEKNWKKVMTAAVNTYVLEVKKRFPNSAEVIIKK